MSASRDRISLLDMRRSAFSPEQQRQMARDLTSFLSQYKPISDSYIIEFFTEDLWGKLPRGWQMALDDLSPPQVADLLLDCTVKDRCYPSVWPLSLLAFRTSAQVLAFSRVPREQRAQEPTSLHTEEFQQNRSQSTHTHTHTEEFQQNRSQSTHTHTHTEEFQQNRSQSSLLAHIFRKHVKPKKQHEIHKLGTLVKSACDVMGCSTVVDVGSGQGHLTRFLSFGLGLSVTAIEADPALVSMASKFDGQLLITLQKERQRKSNSTERGSPAIGPAPHHVVGWVNPKASWEDFVRQLKIGKCESSGHTTTTEPGTNGHSNAEQDRGIESLSLPSAQSCCSDPEVGHDVSSSSTSHRGHLSSLTKTHLTAIQDSQEAANFDFPTCPKRQCTSEKEVSSFRELPGSSPSRTSHAGAECRDRWGPAESGGGPRTVPFILTGLHACGDLSATLLRHYVSCPHVLGITSVACCYMKISTRENPTPPGVLAPPRPTHTGQAAASEFGYPMSTWIRGLPGHQLSYKAREGACHAIEDYVLRLRQDGAALRAHCYRAALEVVMRGQRPHLRRAAVQSVPRAHLMPFSQYAQLGLARVGLPPDLPLDHAKLDAMLQQRGRVVVYFSLALLLAPVVETLLLVDRMLFLQEKGLQSELVPLFDPAFSPRNLVLVSVKRPAVQ